MPEGPENSDPDLWAAAMEIASDGWWDWRLDTDKIRFDRRFYTVAGYTPDAFPENIEEWVARVHPEDLPNLLEKLAACRGLNKAVFEAHYRFRAQNDAWIWIHARGKVVERDSDGRPLRMIGVINDITEKKHAETVHRLSGERYRMVVENALDAIIIAQDERLRYANPSTERMLGYSREELTRVPFAELIHKDDRAMVVDRHQRRLRGESVPDYYSFRALHKSGKARWLEVNTVRTQWEGAPAIQAFMRDITRTKRLEKQLIQAQKMQAIGTLAGGIAHDFNNILSAMMGYTEICLAESGNQSPLAPRLERVLQAGSRARDLVRQILSFSRQRDDDEKPVEIGPIVDEATKLLRPSIPIDIAIDVKLEKETGVVQADPSRIHQIVMNLCVNAAHAMKARGGHLGIHLENLDIDPEDAERFLELPPGPYTRISVSDTGQGMTPEIVKQIFDPYFTTKPQGEGTGLGLSVVHGIVTSLGGAINVYSEPGHGTTFNLYLPQIQSDLDTRPGGRSELPRGNETILLVDDDQFVLEMTAEMLGKLGYTVVPRISSVEALQAFAASPQRFDLIVTDHTMPHMSGLELAQKVREIRPEQPIVLCSGFSPGLTESKYMAYGIHALLNKPVLKSEMAAAIRRTLDFQPAE
ncbi:MAG: PAS domain-containing protein [Desulfobacterales bacterium]|nr:PAS domain-containing protein [Desulfobacterales bacterium]